MTEHTQLPGPDQPGKPDQPIGPEQQGHDQPVHAGHQARADQSAQADHQAQADRPTGSRGPGEAERPGAGSSLETDLCALARKEAEASALEDEMAELCAHINAAQARLLELIARHDQQQLWSRSAGISSETAFLSWKLGFTPSAGAALVGLARRLEDLPHLRAAFSAGELSLSQVTTLARIAEPATDRSLTELALGLSGAQLKTVASYYAIGLRAEKEPCDRRYLSLRSDVLGEYRLSGRLPADQGAVVQRALEVLSDQVAPDPLADDPAGAKRADALTLMAESCLANELKTRAGADAFQAVVHVDAALLAGRAEHAPPPKPAYIEGAGAVTAATARQLACDSSLVELLIEKGRPLSAGRKKRTFSGVLARALEARDKTCRFPGCGAKAWLYNHHIDHWGRGGRTDVSNGLRLCYVHHRLVHRLDIAVGFGADGEPVFTLPSGEVIVRPRPVAATSSLEELNALAGVKVDPSTCLPDWGGEPGDLYYVADLFFENREHDLRRWREAKGEGGGPDP